MDEILSRMWDNLIGRVDGPMWFRIILQPAMATLLGVLDGLRFAREGRSFLLWGGPEDPKERWAQGMATWRSIGKVFLLAITLDVIYQLVTVQWVYPTEVLIVAFVLALIPYFIVRFVLNMATRRWGKPTTPQEQPEGPSHGDHDTGHKPTRH